MSEPLELSPTSVEEWNSLWLRYDDATLPAAVGRYVDVARATGDPFARKVADDIEERLRHCQRFGFTRWTLSPAASLPASPERM